MEARPALATDDFQWSEGLISAARLVAAAVHQLCEAANGLVQGNIFNLLAMFLSVKQHYFRPFNRGEIDLCCQTGGFINGPPFGRLQSQVRHR
jgi:hypothetical protein